MNKIYKVVWSKVKHCYVVTSELAKRNGKGCGARSLRMAAVSMGVAAALLCTGHSLFGMPVAEAAIMPVSGNNIQWDFTNMYKFAAADKSVTVTSDDSGSFTNLRVYGNVRRGAQITDKVPTIIDGVITLKTVCSFGEPYLPVLTEEPLSEIENMKTAPNVTAANITQLNTLKTEAKGNVDGYTVTVESGDWQEVAGGWSDGGKVSNNTVNLNGGTVGNGYETAYGGRSEGTAGNAGNAEYNHVNINGGTAKGNVYGGHSHSSNSPSGDVIGNTVTIAKGKVTGYGSQWIYGGYTWGKDGEGEKASGKAEDNTVIIKGGTLSHGTSAAKVSGGVSNGGDAIHNIVNVENTFTDTLESVTGGEAGENGTATKNEVTVSGGTVNSDVIGGQAAGAVKENKVTVNKITVKGDVVGGFTETGAMENNEVTINGGTVEGTVYGGRTTNGIAGGDSAEKGNKVTVDGKANLYGVYGGYSQSGAASYNTVDVKDCERTSAYGGYSYSGGEVSHNTVTMSGGDSIGLYGGENYSGAGDVTHNTAILKGGAVGLYLFGGYTNGTGKATSNKVEISGGAMTQHGYGYVLAGGRTKDGDALDNTVTISAGEIGKWNGWRNDKTTLQIAGGYVNGYGGKATGNAVDISGGTFGGAYEIDTDTGVETGELGIVVYGGYTRGTDSGIAASNNTVTISKNAVLTGAATVAGGTVNRDKELDPKGSADNNTVTISGGTIGTGDKESTIYGGLGAASASNNTVTIKENTKLNENTNIYGGKAALYYTNYSTLETEEELTGTASNNTVNISSAVTVKGLYGGAGGTAEKNTVTISGGTISKTVYGGYSETGAATQNSVSISGGTVNGNVWGGFSKSGNPTKNSVTISGGMFNGQAIVGGYLQNKTGYNGSANENTVTISGGTFGGNVLFVQGGYTLNADTTNNNTINLTGTVTGLENVSFYGGGSNASNTGNELHVGGIKGGDNGVWQGKTGDTVNNKVKYVGRFDKVVLHSVKWDTAVAALEATTVENVKTLDIQDLSFDKTPSSGEYMALLKSDSDLSAITLDHKNGKGVEITKAGVDLGSSEKTEATGEKGIKLTQTVTEKVKLAEDSKAINYAMDATKNVTEITLGEVNTKDPRDMSGTGFDFTNTAKIDASGLKLVIEQPVDISKAVVPLVTNATNLKAGLTDINYGEGKTNHTQDVSLTHDATGIAVGATMTGKVNTKAGEVDYLVTGATVNSLNLAGWNGAVVSETLVGVTGKTGGVSVTTGEFALPEISTESVTILTMNTDNFFGTVTGKRQYGDSTFKDDEENGVILAGKQSGGVKAEDSGKKLTYYAMKNSAETMTFGEVEFKKDGVARDLKNAYTFDGASTINAKDLTFKDTTEALQKDNSMTLAANAKGITSANAVTQPTNPDIAIAYTDTQGIKFGATAVGTVTAVTNAVQYTVDSVAVNSIGLGGWRGTASAVPTGWALAEGATVDTKDMTEPTAAATIITSGTDDFFKAATISGGKEYKETDFSEEDSGIAFAGKQAKGVKAEGKNLVYALGDKNVTKATVTGEIKWDTEKVYYENTKYAFTDSSKTDISKVKFTATADPLLNQSMTLIKNNVAGTVTEGTPEFTVNMKNTTMEATATGTASIDSGNLQFTVNGVTLNKVTVNGVGSDAVPEGWIAAEDLTVDTSKMELPADMPAAGEEVTILKGSDKIQFSDADISGDNKYGNNPDRFTEEDKTQGAVTIAGKQDKGVAAGADGKSLVYKVGTKDVSSISLGTVKWASGTTLLDASDKAYNFADVTALEGSFAMNYDTPEDVAAKQSMTLLKANETLQDMAKEETNTHQYTNEPVAGVTVQGEITGKLAVKDKAVTFTVESNKATDLTFGKVEWTGSNPLIDHSKTLKNVSFNGATVDTSNIDFYKEMYIEADQTTTLVSDFGGTPKEIKGSKYMVGTAFDGEGSATMENGNLIFRTKTSAGVSEQTHKAVMGVEATMGLLATGKEHEGNVLDGLGNLSNVDSDGASVAASFGGGKDRYETGSHVNINSWSAAVGVGARKETKKGTLQYGIFGEYGKGNYTMHSDVGRSDGDAHYAGGGLMAKWTNKHDVYTEASFRLGRVSDSANDLLRDGAGNAYGYDIHATYYGAHVGLGKVFNYKGGKSLDVYGKFFYTKRDGAEFDAKQHYNLDSVNSSVLRIGARYGTTDKKWNWYGGLAYEYEFDGEAKGTVNGTEIRAASIKGSSVRGEFGMRMDATKDNPWRTDISIYGYGGKHRGFGGSVNVAYTF